RINGRTRLAGVIGNPLDHTLSPAMHNAAYETLDLDWVYIPLRLADETDLMRFLGAARVLPFVGFNVTMPFKQAMLSMCDEVAMLAQLAGAVNTVHCVDGRFIGYNTDGRGLIESLAAETGFIPEGRSVAIVGAGGAAGAALIALILGKASKVSIVNRSLDKAEELVERVIAHARSTELTSVALSAGEEAVTTADLIINATPLGMKDGDPSPVPGEWFSAAQVACDMIYGPNTTPFVESARAAGATAVDGLGMLVHQGAISIDIWSESAQVRAPREVMREAALARLRAGRPEGGGK
ncbi:MAG: shikimate dehydrogenase, partial [Actinomycetota bacterium]|nr:shikimate dehydrogenase [Actinomycetota bacterium]